MTYLLISIPAIAFVLLGCALMYQSVRSDLDVSGFCAGTVLLCCGFMVGSIVMHFYWLIVCAAIVYAVIWVLDRRGVFKVLFNI